MSFNEKLPEWNSSGAEPPQTKKDAGWQPEEKPPADWFNWLFNRVYKCLLELRNIFIAHEQAPDPHVQYAQMADYTTFKDSKGQPNGLAELDETGNVPISQLGNIEQVWEKIAEITIETNIPEVQITGLAEYKNIKILTNLSAFNLTSTSAGKLIFNNDTTASIYARQKLDASGTDVTGQRVMTDHIAIDTLFGSDSPLFSSLGIIDIANVVGKRKTGLFSVSSVTGLTVGSYVVGSFSWDNTEILQQVAITNSLGRSILAGSTITILGVK